MIHQNIPRVTGSPISQTLIRRSVAWVCAVLTLSSGHGGQSVNIPVRDPGSIPGITASAQLVLVVTADWNATSGTLQRFERGADGNWRLLGRNVDCVLGRKGLAWGIGLHGPVPADEPRKREGDQRSPAGAFAFHGVFGRASAPEGSPLKLPYQQMTSTSEAIDDSRSRFYNRIVDRRNVASPDWQSSEHMLKSNGLYDWGIVVEHNLKCAPGYGSCIFLHRWLGPGRGTSGCTAMDSADLMSLIGWLDPKQNPVLVQLPAHEYQLKQALWNLPRHGEVP